MSLLELLLVAVGLSMDAFAVAVCKGLSMPRMSWKKALIVGLYFGGFQGGMPLLGWLLGAQFEEKISAFDHWIAFVLLGLIGFNMIREALSGDEEQVPRLVDGLIETGGGQPLRQGDSKRFQIFIDVHCDNPPLFLWHRGTPCGMTGIRRQADARYREGSTLTPPGKLCELSVSLWRCRPA